MTLRPIARGGAFRLSIQHTYYDISLLKGPNLLEWLEIIFYLLGQIRS